MIPLLQCSIFQASLYRNHLIYPLNLLEKTYTNPHCKLRNYSTNTTAEHSTVQGTFIEKGPTRVLSRVGGPWGNNLES